MFVAAPAAFRGIDAGCLAGGEEWPLDHSSL
jgi:hypothetical protein